MGSRLGGLLHYWDIGKVETHFFLSPGPIFDPEGAGVRDYWGLYGGFLFRGSFRPGDAVQNTHSITSLRRPA